MTDEEFNVVRLELERLGGAINKAAWQIVEQKAALNALQSVLERKRLASPEELEQARLEALKEVRGRH